MNASSNARIWSVAKVCVNIFIDGTWCGLLVWNCPPKHFFTCFTSCFGYYSIFLSVQRTGPWHEQKLIAVFFTINRNKTKRNYPWSYFFDKIKRPCCNLFQNCFCWVMWDFFRNFCYFQFLYHCFGFENTSCVVIVCVFVARRLPIMTRFIFLTCY